MPVTQLPVAVLFLLLLCIVGWDCDLRTICSCSPVNLHIDVTSCLCSASDNHRLSIGRCHSLLPVVYRPTEASPAAPCVPVPCDWWASGIQWPRKGIADDVQSWERGEGIFRYSGGSMYRSRALNLRFWLCASSLACDKHKWPWLWSFINNSLLVATVW